MAGCASLSLPALVRKTQRTIAHTHARPAADGPRYIIRLIGFYMFTSTVSLTGGQRGDLNLANGIMYELK